jgi:hypothetical protein
LGPFFQNWHLFDFRPLLSWPHFSNICTSLTFAHCSQGLISPQFPLVRFSPIALMASFFQNWRFLDFRPWLSWPHSSTICTSLTFAHCSHGPISPQFALLRLSPIALMASFSTIYTSFAFRPVLSWPHSSTICTSFTFAHCSHGLICPKFTLLRLSPIALVASFFHTSHFFAFRPLLSWPHSRNVPPSLIFVYCSHGLTRA